MVLLVFYVFSEALVEFSELFVEMNCFFWQVPAVTVQGSRNFHFSIYGKKNHTKVSEDVSYIHSSYKKSGYC